MKRPPKKLWLEQWPDRAFRDDSIHYEQTGYGDDLRGSTSRITVYVRESELIRAQRELAKLKSEPK